MALCAGLGDTGLRTRITALSRHIRGMQPDPPCGLLTPCSAMVIKKLGAELTPQLLETVRWLGGAGLRVVVEPDVYCAIFNGDEEFTSPVFGYVYTYTCDEAHRWACNL